jgi:hypothetical protein
MVVRGSHQLAVCGCLQRGAGRTAWCMVVAHDLGDARRGRRTGRVLLAPLKDERPNTRTKVATNLVHDLGAVREVHCSESVAEHGDGLGSLDVVLALVVVPARVPIGLTLVKERLAKGSVLGVLARVDLAVSSKGVELGSGHLGLGRRLGRWRSQDRQKHSPRAGRGAVSSFSR